MLTEILPGCVVVTAVVQTITFAYVGRNRFVLFVQIQRKFFRMSATGTYVSASGAGVGLKVIVVIHRCLVVGKNYADSKFG